MDGPVGPTFYFVPVLGGRREAVGQSGDGQSRRKAFG